MWRRVESTELKIENGAAVWVVNSTGAALWEIKLPFQKDLAFFSELLRFLGVQSKTSEVKIIGIKGALGKIQSEFVAAKIPVTKLVERAEPFHLKCDFIAKKIFLEKPSAQAVEVGDKKIRVLIVDDSKTIRDLLEGILKKDPEIEVIGALGNPLEVDGFLARNRPDVITLDIHMPEKDGVTLLREIAPKYQIPTVMISSISKEEGPQVLEALESGAVDYIQKPSFKDLDVVIPQIIDRVKNAAQARVRTLSSRESREGFVGVSGTMNQDCMVVIGSSTGGTEALKELLIRLPSQIPPILIVQHIPAVFSAAFAQRMNSLCPFEVSEAKSGDSVDANHVYIAPGGQQMKVSKKSGGSGLQITVTDDAPVNRHKPSVDFTFECVERLQLPKLLGVILTGMGADGARGLLALRKQGARTIAQNQETSVVYGMPKEAVRLGGAEFELPLLEIPSKLVELSHRLANGKKAG